MTYDQRNAITTPALGLIIWCIDCYELQLFNGIIWLNTNGSAASGLSLPNVVICDKIWMIRNLDVSRYRNGNQIPEITDPSVWVNLTIGAWC